MTTILVKRKPDVDASYSALKIPKKICRMIINYCCVPVEYNFQTGLTK
jgi:hypothetical protein